MEVLPRLLRKRSNPERTSPIQHIRIASPCPVDWSQMVGDERVRHCSECNLNVYNLSAMTEREGSRLVMAHEGKRLCARFYRRADGTVLTQNCPWGLRALKRRVSRVAGAVLSALMSVSFGMAKAKHQSSPPAAQSNAKAPGIAVLVEDQQRAVVAGAEVKLMSQKTGKIIRVRTNEKGRLLLPPVPSGDYQLYVSMNGFRTFSQPVILNEAKLENLKVTLQISETMGIIVTAEAPLIQQEVTVSTAFDGRGLDVPFAGSMNRAPISPLHQ